MVCHWGILLKGNSLSFPLYDGGMSLRLGWWLFSTSNIFIINDEEFLPLKSGKPAQLIHFPKR